MRFVLPKTYLVGFTEVHWSGLHQYLADTGNEAFLEEARAAVDSGVSPGEVLCSFFAKLCYKSLTPGANLNVSRVRAIRDNVTATINAGHMSVFEHVNLNFVTTDCSRVLTHELVRHRAGTAFSQTSGRYARGDQIDFVHDSILDEVKGDLRDALLSLEASYVRLCDLVGINGYEAWRRAQQLLPLVETEDHNWAQLAARVGFEVGKPMPFDLKKQLTSALRRILPNGQANEIGWSINLRALRHTLQLRTHPAAEWEIRTVFAQVFDLVRWRWPLMFADAKVDFVKGLPYVYGMRMQPYERSDDDVIKHLDTETLRAELARRDSVPF